MIPRGAGIGRGRNFTLGTPIFISRRTVSSADKVTCTPRVLIPSNRSALAGHSCVLSGCPCVCVCARVALCMSTCQSWCRLLLVYPLLHASLVSLSSPACLPPHHCLYLHRPCPSRTIFLSGLVAISSLSTSVPSFLPFIPLSLLFSPPLPSSFSFLLPPAPPSPLFLLFFLCLSLSACLYINILLQDCRCLSCNNPISSQMTSWALKAS